MPPSYVFHVGDEVIRWDMARSLNAARKPVSSYGVSTRFNAVGFFIDQLSFVRANDRPGKGWGWEFSFTPGV